MALKQERWRVLRSWYLINNEFLKVRKDEVQLPDGRIYDQYYVIENADWVAIFCLTRGGHVLLTRQYKHGISEFVLELPAGSVHAGETPRQAAARELLEETGFAAEHFELIGDFIAEPTSHTARIYLFLAKDGCRAQEPKRDSRELIEVESVPVAKLLDLVRSGQIKVQGHVAFIYRCLEHLGFLSSQ